jgi:transposase
MRKVNKNFFEETDIYVGLDVHKKSWSVSISVDNILHRTFTISPPSTEVLVKHLRRTYPGGVYHVVYEAGFSGYWAYDELTEKGIDCTIVSPADVPRGHKDKSFITDHKMSKDLAKKLRGGLLEGIYVPEKVLREHRALLRLRDKYIKDRTRIKNYIKGNIMFFGKKREDEDADKKTWSAKYVRGLLRVQYLTPEGGYIMEDLIKVLSFYNQRIKDIDRTIRELSKTQQYREGVKILSSMPGIGLLSAMIFLVEIGDFSRFEDTNKLKSYTGLIPQEHSSGEREVKTGITRRGNKFLKKIIIEASWRAIEKDKTLLSTYSRLTKKMKGSKAIVIIAGILLNRMRSIMKKKETYRIAV